MRGTGPPVWGLCLFSVLHTRALITATEGSGRHATQCGSSRGVQNATDQQRKAEKSQTSVACLPRVILSDPHTQGTIRTIFEERFSL